MNFGALRILASDLMARAGLSAKAGLTFGGSRDLYEALGYLREIRVEDYRARYKRNALAAKVVEAYPEATWRGGAALVEDDNPDSLTEFERAWEDLTKRLKVFPVLMRADILAGLGRYSVILVGAPGDMASPLPGQFKADQLAYLTPFAEDDATIEKIVDDPTDPRFGLPEMYNLKRTGAGKTARKAHHSRIIHVVDKPLDDTVYGQPRLERIWNLLDDLEKVTGGGSEAFWLRAHQGHHYDLDPELEVTPEEIKKMQDAAEELAHGFRRTMATRGAKLNILGSDVAVFNTHVEALTSLIAGGTAIPKRILMGSERGELASSQDKKNWDERVADRRQEMAEPTVLRPLVDLLIKHGALPKPHEYQVVWPDTAALDMKEASEVAERWSKYNGQINGVVVTPAEIRDRVLGLGPLEPEEEAVVDLPGAQPTSAPQQPTQEQKPPQQSRAFEAKRMLAARRVGKARPWGNQGCQPGSTRSLKLISGALRG